MSRIDTFCFAISYISLFLSNALSSSLVSFKTLSYYSDSSGLSRAFLSFETLFFKSAKYVLQIRHTYVILQLTRKQRK
nr:MAG TPA: hypothetical protein [Caudoviricetes sp.]